MAKTRKVLRILTVCIWAASIATVALSFYTAQLTGYNYGPLNSFRTYNGVLTGSAFVLAIVVLAGLLTIHRVDASSQQLVRSMGDALGVDASLPVRVSEVEATVEEELRQTPNSPKGQWLRTAVEEYHGLQSFRRDMKTLLAAPVGLLSAIFAVSAWALPAETFLQNFYVLNTTLLFFVTYGMVVAVASVIAATLVMLSARTATAA